MTDAARERLVWLPTPLSVGDVLSPGDYVIPMTWAAIRRVELCIVSVRADGGSLWRFRLLRGDV